MAIENQMYNAFFTPVMIWLDEKQRKPGNSWNNWYKTPHVPLRNPKGWKHYPSTSFGSCMQGGGKTCHMFFLILHEESQWCPGTMVTSKSSPANYLPVALYTFIQCFSHFSISDRGSIKRHTYDKKMHHFFRTIWRVAYTKLSKTLPHSSRKYSTF